MREIRKKGDAQRDYEECIAYYHEHAELARRGVVIDEAYQRALRAVISLRDPREEGEGDTI